MEGKRAVMGGEHGMDGMPQLVCQCGHITGASCEVHQDVRCILRVDRGAECAALLAFAHFAVEMVLVEDALCQLTDARLEGAEGFQDHTRCLAELESLIRFCDRSI